MFKRVRSDCKGLDSKELLAQGTLERLQDGDRPGSREQKEKACPSRDSIDSLLCNTDFATSLSAQNGEDASQKSGHLIDHLLEYKMHTVLLP